jgi:uncharacterized protein YbjT (DUF2867 family)
MHIILGGTGHVGSATVAALLARRQPVTLITRDGARAEAYSRQGAHVAVADARDATSLRRVFQQGKRLFLLNPPSDPASDTDVEERRTVSAIVSALEGSGLERIVALSSYGAHSGERCGDLTTLYELERAVRAQPIPSSIIRAAYYMSNWDFSRQTARDSGVVQTFFPVDFRLPMVAPQDLGQFAAQLLVEPSVRTGLQYFEGPERYSPNDVAAGFAAALGRPVRAVSVPRAEWEASFESLGFSKPAAFSFARMTAFTVDEQCPLPDAPTRGTTSLQEYLKAPPVRR